MRIAPAVLSVWCSLACGNGRSPDSESGADAGADAGPIEATPPEPPSPPVLTPCPAGWREVETQAGVVACDPWPPSGRADCGPDEFHLPGRPGCERIGTPCPAGDYADDLPDDTRFFVLPGAPAGGDGTRARPFGRVFDTLAASLSGDVIALGKGTLDESVILRQGVTLWGACVAETTIRSSAGPAVDMLSGAVLRNVTTTHAGQPVAVVTVGNGTDPTTIESVVVSTPQDHAIASQGRLVLRDSAVRGVAGAVEPPAMAGPAISLFLEADVEIERVAVEGTWGGVVAGGPKVRVSVRDAAFVEYGRAEEATGGAALWIDDGAQVDAHEVAIERGRFVAVRVGDPGTSLTLEDCTVRSTAVGPDGSLGTGLQVLGGNVEVRRSWIAVNRNAGVVVGRSGVITLEDVLIEDTSEADRSDGGIGLALQEGAHATVARLHIDRSTRVGVLLALEGTVLEGSDVGVVGTRSGALDGRFGDGLQLWGGASVDLSRVALLRNRREGLVALDTGSVARIVDLLVESTAASACAETGGCDGAGGGCGLATHRGAAASSERFRISANALCGVQVGEGSAMDLIDGEVSANPIGANVQSADFDFSRIGGGVVYRENERNLDATRLPAPDASGVPPIPEE